MKIKRQTRKVRVHSDSSSISCQHCIRTFQASIGLSWSLANTQTKLIWHFNKKIFFGWRTVVSINSDGWTTTTQIQQIFWVFIYYLSFLFTWKHLYLQLGLLYNMQDVPAKTEGDSTSIDYFKILSLYSRLYD
jgi:hypothetical protein